MSTELFVQLESVEDSFEEAIDTAITFLRG